MFCTVVPFSHSGQHTMPSHTLRPERTRLAGSLEIPRMLNGLWQLAGGHDKHVDIASAATAMDSLCVHTWTIILYCIHKRAGRVPVMVTWYEIE